MIGAEMSEVPGGLTLCRVVPSREGPLHPFQATAARAVRCRATAVSNCGSRGLLRRSVISGKSCDTVTGCSRPRVAEQALHAEVTFTFGGDRSGSDAAGKQSAQAARGLPRSMWSLRWNWRRSA